VPKELTKYIEIFKSVKYANCFGPSTLAITIIDKNLLIIKINLPEKWVIIFDKKDVSPLSSLINFIQYFFKIIII